jgi:hypothetical protein
MPAWEDYVQGGEWGRRSGMVEAVEGASSTFPVLRLRDIGQNLEVTHIVVVVRPLGAAEAAGQEEGHDGEECGAARGPSARAEKSKHLGDHDVSRGQGTYAIQRQLPYETWMPAPELLMALRVR